MLGTPLVNKLTVWFCERELAEFDTAFDPSQHRSLEGSDRRYSWLRRWLRGYAHSFAAVFPAAWQVPLHVAEECCLRARNHVSVLLQRAAQEQLDVRQLLHLIQKTLELEQVCAV